MTAPTIRTELASAIRAVNAGFGRLPKSAQESIVIGYDALDAEVEEAIATGDRGRALRAIEGWRCHWLSRFGGAGQ